MVCVASFSRMELCDSGHWTDSQITAQGTVALVREHMGCTGLTGEQCAIWTTMSWVTIESAG